mgnify:CR=1 FL=1
MGGMMSYTHTKVACYLGYVTQALANNFAPLLFLIFRDSLGVSLGQVTVLIAVNFGVQLLTDVIASGIADRIGYRPCMIAAHIFAACGIAGLAFLPFIMPPFAGLLVAVVLYACGGGLIEVIISPLVEACPSKNKSAEMSLLHSFYCWGSVAVIAATTLFINGAGEGYWRIAAISWALLPLANAIYFIFVPIRQLCEKSERMPVKKLLTNGRMWLFVIAIFAAGAAELSMSQWASAFAESGLGIPKWAGDIAGPCLFAALMGTARLLGSVFGKRLPLKACLLASGSLCICCYLAAALSPFPVFALAGCALCGFSVGLMWPGIFSISAAELPAGGTAMFALLAVAGDLGGLAGPSAVGAVADGMGGSLQGGILLGVSFPALFVVCMLVMTMIGKRKDKNKTIAE